MNIADYASLFKALCEPVRLRIVCLILERGELCVCDIVDALDLSQSVVSRHLAYLRNADLLAARRDGVWVYYQLLSGVVFTDELLALFKVHSRTAPELKADLERVAAQEGGRCC